MLHRLFSECSFGFKKSAMGEENDMKEKEGQVKNSNSKLRVRLFSQV